MSTFWIVSALIAFSAIAAYAQDPADSWLVYAGAKAGGDRITFLNASWVVPSYPTDQSEGNAPGWWFGIEPEDNMDLIQPILAWGDLGSEFTIFNGYYQWDDDDWYQSESGAVTPGNHVYAYVKYRAENDSYDMYIECKETGFSVWSNIGCENGKVFTNAYFVVEHQPDDCQQYPSNGYIVFDDINMEVAGKPVTPSWAVYQYQPACNSEGQVLSSSSLKFTWDTSYSKINLV